MTCGVLLPGAAPRDTARVVEAARTAERLGFAMIWCADDLAGPQVDAPVCAAAAVAATESIGVGLGVAAGRRTAMWSAKHLTTLEALAPGRLTVGVDLAATDAAPLTDLPELLGLLGGEPLTATDAPPEQAPAAVRPALKRPPRLLVGGSGPGACERAARHGAAWMTAGLAPTQLAGLEAPPALAVLLRVGHEDRGPGAASLPDSIDDAVQRVSEYRAAGAQSVLFAPAAHESLTGYERLAEIVARVRIADQ